MTGVLVWLYIVELLKYWTLIHNFGEMKIKRKWMSLVGGVIYFLLSINKSTKENELHITMYVIVMFVVYIMLEGTVREKIASVLIMRILISCAESIFQIPVDYFLERYQGMYDVSELTQFIIGFIMLCFIMTGSLLKKKLHLSTKPQYKIVIMKSAFVLSLLLAFLLAFIVKGINYAESELNDYAFTLFSHLVGVISFICIAGLVWIMAYMNKENKNMEKALKVERNLKEIQIEYYKIMLNREKHTRKFRHDMNNHFICLTKLARDKKVDLIAEYISEMQEPMNEINEKIYMVGNEILDAILNHHLTTLEEETVVEITGMCPEDIPINQVDLCTIFANLIQNACEELEKHSTTAKYLKIKIESGQEFLGVEFINSLSEESYKKSNLLQTRKKDWKNHGFGLQNVKKAVEKNKGIFKIEITEREFLANVILKKS